MFLTERESQFGKISENCFLNNVYKENGTVKLIEDFESRRISYPDKDSPIYHLYEAVKVFREFLEGLDQNQIKEFLSYVLQNVYFVYIITDNRSSAFSTF